MTKSNLMGKHYRISSSVVLSPNVPSIAAVAELELQNLKIYTNVK